MEQNVGSHHIYVPTFLTFTHLTCPSSLGLIYSSHSFRNYFSVIIQHFPEISVVIFLHDLALLLMSSTSHYEKELSLISLKSFPMKYFFIFLSWESQGSPFISLQMNCSPSEERIHWIDSAAGGAQEPLACHLCGSACLAGGHGSELRLQPLAQ